MLPSNSCNKDRVCPGFVSAIVAAVLMIAIMLGQEVFADVRVEIKRELPEETQHIVQQFHDEDSFAMWMGGKLEGEGCDPYVTEIRIFRNYNPKDGGNN
jgi:hypothetical protein